MWKSDSDRTAGNWQNKDSSPPCCIPGSGIPGAPASHRSWRKPLVPELREAVTSKDR